MFTAPFHLSKPCQLNDLFTILQVLDPVQDARCCLCTEKHHHSSMASNFSPFRNRCSIDFHYMPLHCVMCVTCIFYDSTNKHTRVLPSCPHHTVVPRSRTSPGRAGGCLRRTTKPPPSPARHRRHTGAIHVSPVGLPVETRFLRSLRGALDHVGSLPSVTCSLTGETGAALHSNTTSIATKQPFHILSCCILAV